MTHYFNQAELAAMPKLYETEHIAVQEKLICARLFIPGQWQWYVIETDGEDQCFGLVIGDDTEFGYFSLSELANQFDPWGSPWVERDEYFEPATVAEVLA